MTTWIYNNDVSYPVEDGVSWINPETGTQHPGTNPKGEIPGMTAVVETARPTDSTIVVTGSTIVLIAGVPTQVWQSRVKTTDEIAADVAVYTNAAQQHLDASARVCGYDGILSAVTYADDATVPAFQAEGKGFRVWRSQVWDSALATMMAVKGGGTAPTIEAFISNLPACPVP